MSTHLPECYKEGSTDSCICDWLRACEQRVRDEILTAAYESAPSQVRQDEVARLYNIGFADALDAAREAVAALRYHLSLPLDDTVIYRTDALAAIDALRTGQEAEPQGHEQQPQAHHPRQESTP